MALASALIGIKRGHAPQQTRVASADRYSNTMTICPRPAIPTTQIRLRR